MIFSELRSYAEDKLGPGAWNAVLIEYHII